MHGRIYRPRLIFYLALGIFALLALLGACLPPQWRPW